MIQCLREFFIVNRPKEVKVEQILPRLAGKGARFYFQEVEGPERKHGESFEQRTGDISGRKGQRCFHMTPGWPGSPSQYQKPRIVLAVLLNIPIQDAQLVRQGRLNARDGRCISTSFLLYHFCGSCGVIVRHDFDTLHRQKELFALTERLWVREDKSKIFPFYPRKDKKLMPDSQRHLTDYAQRIPEKKIVILVNAPENRVLNRDDAEPCAALRDGK